MKIFLEFLSFPGHSGVVGVNQISPIISTYCNGNCPCQNFRSKNSFKSDVALKHAPDERPVKKADQKSEIAPARDDEKRRRRKQSLEHGDVPIFGVYTT